MEQQRKSYRASEQKSLYAQKQDDNIAKAMSRLHQRQQQAKEEEEIFRMLSKPRSKKYIELVKKSIQMTQRLGELEARRRELSAKSEQEAEKALCNVREETPTEPEEEAGKAWWNVREEASVKQERKAPTKPERKTEAVPPTKPEEEAGKAWWEVREEKRTEPEQETETGWWDVREEASAKQEQTLETSRIEEEINREMEQIRQELEELNRALDEEMPMYSRSLGFIYSFLKEEALINQGVISGPGTPFFSLADLLDLVQSQTEQEKKQWATGNQVYRENWSKSLLVVEVYLTAVCVVWDDGSVKCYSD
ncbi:MAG: hypothetical protein NC417_01785 [Candidatus Gastranaerophilales bacterium]|nr:hypothetical protein [Candidatus Gastranaerophilales bacterium]